MNPALSQFIKNKALDLCDDLKEALSKGNWDLASLIIKSLHILEPEMRGFETLPTTQKKATGTVPLPERRGSSKRNTGASKVNKTKHFLLSSQVDLLKSLLGLGREQISFEDFARQSYPALKNVANISTQKEYMTLWSRLKGALRKIDRIHRGETETSLLPFQDQEVYKLLQESYPGKTTEELKKIIYSHKTKRQQGSKSADFL